MLRKMVTEVMFLNPNDLNRGSVELIEHDFDVEGESGKIEVIFVEPEAAKFVISPNTPIREIWVSALSTSFKLGWSESRNAFVLEKTGEDLYQVMTRVISQQVGTQVTV